MAFDELCPYELSKILKEKGFNEICNYYYAIRYYTLARKLPSCKTRAGKRVRDLELTKSKVLDVMCLNLECNNSTFESEYTYPKREIRDPDYFYTHHEYASAPSLSMVQKWLMKIKNIVVVAQPDYEIEIHDSTDYLTGKWFFSVWKDGERVYCNFDPNKEEEEIWLFDTYEQSLLAGITKAIELI